MCNDSKDCCSIGMELEDVETYIGVKIIKAKEMSQKTFLKQIKEEEVSKDQEDMLGYVVEYEDGYISWSPKDCFEKSYRKLSDDTKEFINSI